MVKENDLIKVALTMEFLSLACTMVTSQSETLLCMTTLTYHIHDYWLARKARNYNTFLVSLPANCFLVTIHIKEEVLGFNDKYKMYSKIRCKIFDKQKKNQALRVNGDIAHNTTTTAPRGQKQVVGFYSNVICKRNNSKEYWKSRKTTRLILETAFYTSQFPFHGQTKALLTWLTLI